MPLEPIGDIGVANLTQAVVSETLTWETASDWDNAVSEFGVVHESVADTDHSDETVIKKGYSATSPMLSPDAAWLLHEDSGSTAHDVSGNNNDGTINGTNLGVTGLLGTTGFRFDGSGSDWIGSIPFSHPAQADFTVLAWVKTPVNKNGNNYVSTWTGDAVGIILGVGASSVSSETFSARTRASNTNQQTRETSNKYNDDVWHLLGYTWDHDNEVANLYADGSDVSDTQLADQGSLDSLGSDDDFEMGRSGNRGEYFDGDLAGVWVFNNTILSASNISDFYDVVGGESTLTTATKSLSAQGQPDLQNLSYTLNGESITLDVIGSPGTASEEIVSQSLDGATSYTLSWSNSHTDFRIKPRLSTSDVTTTPTFSRGELVT